MNNEPLQQAVAAATATAWPDFAAQHPALSQAIDQRMLSEHLTRTLADDPAFVEAYRGAIEANVAQNALADLVKGFVVPAIRRLL